MVNGIEDVAVRSDFLDRALVVNAPAMSKLDRKAEDELDRAFHKVYPAILGALLTRCFAWAEKAARSQEYQASIATVADFARWMMAVETGLGWESGTFMGIMARNEDDSNESVVAGSLVAENIRKWIVAKGTWDGTWSELLIELNTLPMKRRSV